MSDRYGPPLGDTKDAIVAGRFSDVARMAMRFLSGKGVLWAVSAETDPRGVGTLVATATILLARPGETERVSVSCSWSSARLATIPSECVEGVVWADVERLVEDLRARVRSMGGRM